VFVLQSTGLIGKGDSDFKNLPYGIAIGINLCFLLGSFTILLNLKEYVRANPLYKALSFFLLPGIIVLFVLFAGWDQPWPGVLFCVPYLIVLFIFLFVQKNTKYGILQIESILNSYGNCSYWQQILSLFYRYCIFNFL
jgi:peptidoglycan/LPS O-acetylase OafA/YrhL